MSDYTVQATWSTKDALATGQALKAISATELGNEFDAIATAILSKHDSSDIASSAEAELLTSPGKLITPSTLNDVLVANAGILKDLQAMADPGADRVFGWDETTNSAIGFTLGTGLEFSGTSLIVTNTDLVVNNANWSGADLAVANGGTGASDAGTARTNLGLGSLATLSSISDTNWSGTDLSVANGGTGSSTAAAARTALGLAIGTDVQAFDADLAAIAALSSANSNFIVGNGSTWVAENALTARTSLGVGTGDSPQLTGINLGHASDTTITRASAGQLEVAGDAIFSHDSTTYTSAKVFFSTSAPTTEGNDGDIWFRYA